MANCKDFMSLDVDEQCIMIGQAAHLLRTDSESFAAIGSMIRSAQQQGKFDKVKFGHAEIIENEKDEAR